MQSLAFMRVGVFVLLFFRAFFPSFCGVAHGRLAGSDAGSQQQPCILHPVEACLKGVSVLVAGPSTPTRTYTPYKQTSIGCKMQGF